MRTRVLLGALALVSLVAVFTTRVSRKMPDFEVYWTAGSRAIAAQPLYRADDGHFQFKYLPAFALLVSPLATVPLPLAKALWFGGSAVDGVLSLAEPAGVPSSRGHVWLLVHVLAMASYTRRLVRAGDLLFGAGGARDRLDAERMRGPGRLLSRRARQTYPRSSCRGSSRSHRAAVRRDGAGLLCCCC